MPDRGSNISFGLSARFLLVIAGVAVLSNILLILSFLNFFPLHRVQTFFVQTQDISNKDVLIKPFEVPAETQALKIKEALVRQYVLDRERFSTDYRVIENMWGGQSSLRLMSSRLIYQNFMDSLTYKKVFTLGNPARKSRFVEIQEVNYHPELKEWEIVGRTVDYQDKAVDKQVQDLRVILKGDFLSNTQKMSYENQFKNPFGFVVTEYKYLRYPSY